MGHVRYWSADREGHLQSAPGFRRRHMSVHHLTSGQPQAERLYSKEFNRPLSTPQCRARERPFGADQRSAKGARQPVSRVHTTLATPSSTLYLGPFSRPWLDAPDCLQRLPEAFYTTPSSSGSLHAHAIAYRVLCYSICLHHLVMHFNG
jgi:hypothetical protein